MHQQSKIVFHQISNDVKESGKKTALAKLDQAIESSLKPLMVVKAFILLDLFPDEMIIERDRIHLVAKELPGTRYIQTFDLENIAEVQVETTPLFSKLTLIDKTLKESKVEIKNLKTGEAMKARRIIQGLLSARDKKIDLSEIPDDEVIDKLEELGRVRAR